MEELIERIRNRLAAGSYPSEAAVSHGILVPILRALGWDETDPDQVIPEFTSGRGRVDFALCGGSRRPEIFIEVKGVGRSVEGDRQLFEYAFHEGVPLCLLTDGREWGFYLPSGQGSYDDRRIYRLQLDDRPSSECARVLERYLDHGRVRSGAAREDALRDYRDSANQREAARMLPRAWGELAAEPEELLVDLLAERAETLCGFRPPADQVIFFLRDLQPTPAPISANTRNPPRSISPPPRPTPPASMSRPEPRQATPATASRALNFRIFGETRTAPTANAAFLEVLTELARRKPDRVERLAQAVKARSRNHIARSAAEIYPARPDLARAAEFSPGWFVGLNIANREKTRILQIACDVFDVKFGSDVDITLPNA